MSDETDIESGQTIGQTLEDAANAVLGDDDTPEGQATADPGDSGSSPGAIEQIGGALRPVLEYMHDTADDPPERTGPHPAGGPH